MAMLYTPHGDAADAAVSTLLDKAWEALRQRKLLPSEMLAHYVIGDYGRGEGWVVQEQEVWVPYDTPHLFILLPDGFEDEAATLQQQIAAQLNEICQDVGYSLRVSVSSAEGLYEHPPLAFEVAFSRRLSWCFGGFDPLESFKGIGAERLEPHGVSTILRLEAPMRELAHWSKQDILGLHQGIIRLAFIRCVEVISGLGDAALMKAGRYRSQLDARKQAILDLAESEQIHAQFASLYAAAISLRIHQPHPTLPAWHDLCALIQEIMLWGNYLAQTQFEAQLASQASSS